MNKSHHHIGSSFTNSSSDLIDAKLEEHQMCGSKQCPGCGHKLERRPDWLGLPAGVKFDPTDQELIEHLEAKVEGQESKSHPLIDEFIPTIEGEDGICYTHPEKLPGVTRDGLSRHFFHRPSKAYTTGTRKRRKIQTECDLQGGETRWHKTGKTRPVMVNGKQKGCKKILVLYTNFGKNRKPEKTNWVMHQYHLGQLEEEKEGELVVSKIFYQTQPRQCNWSDRGATTTTTTTTTTTGEGSSERNSSRRESGTSGSCTSSREVISTQRDEAVGIVSYNPIDHIHQHMKSDHFSFVPFRKTFDVEMGIEEGSKGRREGVGSTSVHQACHQQQQQQQQQHEEHEHPVTVRAPHHVTTHEQQQQQHHHVAPSTAFHVSRPSHPTSTVISPPPLHHHTSILLDEDSYNMSRIILQTDKFQQQHKLGGRSGSGLEELWMGCTSNDIKEESSITNQQEAEWLKYPYWPDPDNPDHHG